MIAYRYEQPPQQLTAHFDSSSKVSLSTIDIPTRTVWKTDPKKCHLNFVPEDSWETQFVEKIERMDEVLAYVKNQQLDFHIPYTHEGRAGNYYLDYIPKIDDGHGIDDLRHVIVEITAEKKKDKQAKVDTTRDYWVPAVNNDGTRGRWAFLEIDGTTRNRPMQTIRQAIAKGTARA